MTDHEKRIREASEEGPYYTAMVAKPDLRDLLADLDAMRAALSEANAGGWVAAPVEPTPEMLRAAVNAVCIDTQAIEEGDHISLTWDEAKDVFAAMLAARPLPAPPAQKEPT